MRPISIAVLLYSLLPETAVAQSNTTSATTGLLQIVAALAVVIAVMLAMAWLMKRVGGISPLHRFPMKVIGAVSLGNRERVVVIEVADQCLVLGVTAQQITLLSNLPKQESIAVVSNPDGQAAINNKFTEWLKASIEKRTPSASQD